MTLAFSKDYLVRLAGLAEEITAAQRLRFEVFNLELGEGLAASRLSGLDCDAYDTQCDHLIVEEIASGRIVGTYRLQTGRTAGAGIGYYSAQEFDLSPFDPFRDRVLELGRACIHRDHRRRAVLELLWKGIAAYAKDRRCEYLLGCSSLTSQAPAEGWAVYRLLEPHHLASPEFRTSPLPHCRMEESDLIPAEAKVPRLFAAYLRIGAQIAGPPAIDRDFGTIDFLTLLDLNRIASHGRRHYLDEPV